MASRETPKATPKVQRTIVKAARPKASPVTNKKAISCKNNTEKVLKVENTPIGPRTSTAPKMSSPKPKEHKPISAKKPSWKRRPKPAHSGVPVPERMKKLFADAAADLADSE